MPVGGSRCAEGPGDGMPVQSAANFWVLSDIDVIVEVQERSVGYWVVERQRG